MPLYLLYHGAKKSKMTKNLNQGGPALRHLRIVTEVLSYAGWLFSLRRNLELWDHKQPFQWGPGMAQIGLLRDVLAQDTPCKRWRFCTLRSIFQIGLTWHGRGEVNSIQKTINSLWGFPMHGHIKINWQRRAWHGVRSHRINVSSSLLCHNNKSIPKKITTRGSATRRTDNIRLCVKCSGKTPSGSVKASTTSNEVEFAS